MKIFSAIFVAAIVAITIGRCRAEFLLVQVDDVAAKGPRSNNTAKAREIEELARQGICDIKPCCCDSCYPCDYEKIFGTKNLAEAKFNEKPQDPRGPSSCGIRGCGPPPCPTPCSRSARSDDDLLTCGEQFNCYNVRGSQCVPLDAVCDGKDDCRNGRDETGCPREPIETKCISGDKEYKMGETRISSDGCNTCTCMYSGPWECTTMACNRLDTKPTKLSEFGKQCAPGKITDCPADTCNLGGCNKGCAVGACTRKRCDVHTKGENQLCYIDTNNCDKGLKCMKQDDGCNNGIGRCVKSDPGVKCCKAYGVNPKCWASCYQNDNSLNQTDLYSRREIICKHYSSVITHCKKIQT